MNAAVNAFCALSVLLVTPSIPATSVKELMAPAKTPPEIVSKLNTAVMKTLNTSAIQEGMAAIGNEPRGTSPLELATFIDDCMKQIREIVRISGVKLED